MYLAVPSDDDSPLAWLLLRQSQVLSRQQALAELGRGALQNRLAQGRWQRAGREIVGFCADDAPARSRSLFGAAFPTVPNRYQACPSQSLTTSNTRAIS